MHLASGIGNIVLATPLLRVLARNGFLIDLLLDADYPGVGELFDGWRVLRRVFAGRDPRCSLLSYGQILVAVPPFYWRRYRSRYADLNPYRPSDMLFYENEQAYYLEFARAVGCEVSPPPYYYLPVPRRVTTGTIVLAPGSKPLEMAAKRWPFFARLAEAFDDVALVGTDNDLLQFGGGVASFPSHVRSFLGQLSLRETAVLLSEAAAVVANDCGLGHLAGALGVPTLLLFGPTPHGTLGKLPPNVTILRAGLPCEPCWFRARLDACRGRVSCLAQLRAETVMQAVRALRRGTAATAT